MSGVPSENLQAGTWRPAIERLKPGLAHDGALAPATAKGAGLNESGAFLGLVYAPHVRSFSLGPAWWGPVRRRHVSQPNVMWRP